MPAWKEAQYVIDELREEIQNKGTGVLPPPVKEARYFWWDDNSGIVDIFINKELGLPKSVEIGGFEIVSVESIVLVRKFESFPESPTDGDFILEKPYPKEDDRLVLVFTDKLNDERDRYYCLYTKSTQGVYSQTPFKMIAKRIRCSNNFSERMYPGLVGTVSTSVADPFKRVVLNSVYEPVKDEVPYSYYKNIKDPDKLDGGPEDYLLMRRFLTHCLKNYPAAVNDDGTVRYWLDPKDYKKKIDGTPSDWDNPNFDGNFCAWINRLALYCTHVPNTYDMNIHIQMGNVGASFFSSNETYDDFYDWDGNLLKGIWIPMLYQGMDDKRHFTSEIFNGDGKTGEEIFTEIQKKSLEPNRKTPICGPRIFCFLRNLLILISKGTNSQASFGTGLNSLPSDIIYNEIVNDGLILPGFGRSESGFIKAFHSNVFLTNAVPILDLGAWLLKRNSNDNLYYFYNHNYQITGRGTHGSKQTDKISNVGINSLCFSVKEYNFSTRKDGTASVQYADNVFEPLEANSNGSSNTYNCDTTMVNNIGSNVPSGTYMNIFRGRYVVSAADMKNSGMFMINGYGVYNSTKLNWYTIPWGVLPPPDYDPFEATGYHPWEEEE